MNKRKLNQLLRLVFIIIFATIISTVAFVLLYKNGIIAGDSSSISNWVSAIVSTFAFLSTAAAVYLAYRSLYLAQMAEEGNLYLKMMDRYASKEMREALRMLSVFYKANEINLEANLKEWNKERLARVEAALKIDDARHTVKYFYRDLMQLVQAGYFSRELAKRICNSGGRQLFVNLILPMDKVLNVFSFEDEYKPYDKIFAELDREQQKVKGTSRTVCLIPARYDSSRFDGKLLKVLIDGEKRKTVIRETYERMSSYGIFDEVIVVTNSREIENELKEHGGHVVYNNNTTHESGTDRIAEAIVNIEADIIFNVQGDEPFIAKKPLADLVELMKNETDDLLVASLMKELTHEENINSSDFVKVTTSKSGRAINFSRSITPFPKKETHLAKYYEHVGVYAFTRKALLGFAQLEPTPLERVESVECLRFLKNDIPIKMIETDTFLVEIDTQQDLDNVNALLAQGVISLV